MEKMNTIQSLFPHLPERLAGSEVLFKKSAKTLEENNGPIQSEPHF
jgi:hypothetical protein